MFEYDSNPPRSWSFYFLGGLYLIFVLGFAPLLQAAEERYGKIVFLIPGTTLLFVTAIFYSHVNRRRGQFVEVDGLITDAEDWPELTPEQEEGGYMATRDLKIRFKLESGEPYTVEISGFYRDEVGDSVPMLYEPAHPEQALPVKLLHNKLYEECRKLGCVAILMLMGGCGATYVF